MKTPKSKNALIALAVITGILAVFALTRAYYTRGNGSGVATFDLSVPVPGRSAAQLAALSPSQRGDWLFDQGRFADSIPEYRQAIKLNPKDVDSHNDLGLALHYTGKSAEAVEILKQGTRVGPTYQRIWLSLGFILIHQGKNEEAALTLQTVVSLGPNTAQGREASRLLGEKK